MERVIRTIKEKLYRHFSLMGTYKWIDVLPSIIREYNNTKHRTIQMKPIDVTTNNERDIYNKIYQTLIS